MFKVYFSNTLYLSVYNAPSPDEWFSWKQSSRKLRHFSLARIRERKVMWRHTKYKNVLAISASTMNTEAIETTKYCVYGWYLRW